MTTKNFYLTPIIKVVGNYCNNRCKYCFYHNLDQRKYKRMSFDLLESFLSQHIKLSRGNMSFIWHGGEPLLAGLDFFGEVIRLQKLLVPKDRLIRNSVQTNGTLITEDWAEFFKKNEFKVGVSLDGGEESHNRFRLNHTGNSTFNNTINGIKILLKKGIKLSVIQTIPKANISYLEEDFEFFVTDLKLLPSFIFQKTKYKFFIYRFFLL